MKIDVQHLPAPIPISIDKVGVDNLDVPISIVYKHLGRFKRQHVVAKVSAFAKLPRTRKGIDMSRLPEVLCSHTFLTVFSFRKIAKTLKNRLGLEDIYIRFDFPFLTERISPVTKIKFPFSYDCWISVIYPPYRHFVGVKVPVQTTCPCSKELCLVDREQGIGFGAHNQRAEVTVQVRTTKVPGVFFETLINIIEKAASSPVYTILKRKDEQYVTEKAYKDPVFVEDLARRVARKLTFLKNIDWFRIKVESFESIHKHNAVAYIGRVKKGNRWYYNEHGFV